MTRIREFIGSNILFAYILSVLITYQFYFPVIGNKNLTVFIVLAVVLGLLSFKNEYLEIRAYQIYYYCIFLVFIYISFLYSTDKIDALKHLIYLSLPLPIYYYFKIFSADKIKVLKVFVFSALPYLLGVFLLFLFEKYELAILNSGIMKIFIEPDTLLDLARNFSNYNIWENYLFYGWNLGLQ
ncbi:MAG: hypothetical protein NT145_03385 [Elusimicrobia bacterium]|nr:hypothetical protein [Elusimicrobiota bacterium]